MLWLRVMKQQAAGAVSRRAQEITPFLVMDILERAQELERQGEHIIHLEIGEPDYDTPQVVKDAAYRAMAAGETQYTHSQGLMELREALCQHYLGQVPGVRLSPEQFIVTSGTSPAMILIFGALLDPGDEVLLPDLHYACYPNVLRLVDAVPRYVPVQEEDGFQLNPAELGPGSRPAPRRCIINSPGNPTGTLLPPSGWPAWRIWALTSSPTRSTTAWCTKARSTPSWSSPTGPLSSTAFPSSTP